MLHSEAKYKNPPRFFYFKKNAAYSIVANELDSTFAWLHVYDYVLIYDAVPVLNNQNFNGLVSLRCCTIKSSMSYLVGAYISLEHPL